jgi:hypothetical protein
MMLDLHRHHGDLIGDLADPRNLQERRCVDQTLFQSRYLADNHQVGQGNTLGNRRLGCQDHGAGQAGAAQQCQNGQKQAPQYMVRHQFPPRM